MDPSIQSSPSLTWFTNRVRNYLIRLPAPHVQKSLFGPSIRSSLSLTWFANGLIWPRNYLIRFVPRQLPALPRRHQPIFSSGGTHPPFTLLSVYSMPPRNEQEIREARLAKKRAYYHRYAIFPPLNTFCGLIALLHFDSNRDSERKKARDRAKRQK